MVANPASSASAEHNKAFGRPTRVAKAPHIVLPIAIPPCRTKRYIDRALALIQDGHMVCAAVFRHAALDVLGEPAMLAAPPPPACQTTVREAT